MLALRMQHGCVSLVTTYISLLKEAKGQYYVILTELENSVGLILILRKRFCKNQWHYPLAAFVLLNFHSLDLFPSWFIFEYTIMFIHICTCGLWSPIRIIICLELWIIDLRCWIALFKPLPILQYKTSKSEPFFINKFMIKLADVFEIWELL